MKTNKRVIEIDLLRAIAVILMVEGHTVHVFLNNDLRNPDSLVYSFWVWLRGFTAPVFMFVSGLIFTYLLLNSELKPKPERIIKGIKRGLFLIFTGYLLRFPTFNPFRIGKITNSQILTFFSVDALHIIGLGIIFVALISMLIPKIILVRFPHYVYLISALAVFVIGYFIDDAVFVKSLPIFISSYFTNEYGSVFTLFPWLGYIFFGATISVLIKRNLFKEKTAIVFFGMVSLLTLLLRNTFGESYFGLIAERISFVLILFSLLKILSHKIARLPKSVLVLGKNTLAVYIVHLVILYGSPISLGFYQIIPSSLNLVQTVFAVLLMEVLMFYIAMLKEKNMFKIKNIFYRKTYAKSR